MTNLNDSGTGSLRAALATSGARVVVFEVSGIINLQSELKISNDFITIAGQTSPGGVLVTGYMTKIQASHVIVRHMRFRVGTHGNGSSETKDSLDIWGVVNSGSGTKYDIIVDHCSVGWGVDENFSTAYHLERVTISNCLIAEALSNAGHPKGEHSKGLFVWGKFSPELQITIHHNFIAHNKERNPLINTGTGNLTVDLVNNVSYNFFGGYAMGSTSSNVKLNWVHNYSRPGNKTNSSFYEIYHETGGTPSPIVYVLGNIGGSRLQQGGSEWTVASSWRFNLQNEAWRRSNPWSAPSVTTTIMTADYARAVVNNSGANKPVRDSADQKVVDSYMNGTGGYINNVSFPSGYPTYQNLASPTDTDNDGMSDTWENANGTNPLVNDSSGDIKGEGYTNIEYYINELADGVISPIIKPNPPNNLN